MQNDNQKQALIYQRYDAAYKMLLRNPQAFCRFMQGLVDEALMQNLRPQNIEMVNKSFVSEQGLQYEADLIYKVSIDSIHVAYFYILMEFQSRPDASMAYRMLNYIVQFWGSLEKQDTLPAVFPIVLYNGDRAWNAKTELSECIENAGIREIYIPKMRYYLIDINAVQNEELDALVASVVYAEQHSGDNQSNDYIEKLGRLADKIIPADLQRVFAKWFVTIFTGTMPQEKVEQIQYSLKEKDGNMLADLGERIYNEGIEKGIERGREEGIERGIERGREEGIERGREEGMEKGIEKGRMEVARNMLANGLDIAQVSKCTGLSRAAVRKLQDRG